MDPISIFQVVGTAVSLSEVVVKSLVKLNSIRTRYHKCPLLVSTMIGQLYIVQSALNRLSAWNNPEQTQDPRHQQLGSQVGNSLDSFKTLVLALQQHLDRFEATTTLEMGVKKKLRFLWNEKDMSEYSILLDRQVNALTLLLQALECSTWSQQDALVSQPDNQEILRAARDCSSSIVGLDDGSLSILSENTELISINFDFDTTILGCRVYQLAERSHLRQAIKGARFKTSKRSDTQLASIRPGATFDSISEGDSQSEIRPSPTPDLGSVSWRVRGTRLGQWWKNPQVPRIGTSGIVQSETTQALKEPPGSKVQRVLILGASESGKSTLHKSMILAREKVSGRFRTSFTENIWDNLMHGTSDVLECMERLGLDFDDRRAENHATLLRRLQATGGLSRPEAIWAIETLWKDTGFQKAYLDRRIYHLNEGYSYFVRHAERIMSPGYVPSDQDIIFARTKTVGFQETKFEGERVSYTVYDVGGARSERKKWVHVCPHTDTVIYTVDVTAYTRLLSEELFGSIINSNQFTESSIILMFTKVDLLEEYIRIIHPRAHFPYLEEGERYLAYLEQRFMSLAKSDETHRRVRVVYSSFQDVDTRNPAKEIFDVLDELSSGSGWRRETASIELGGGQISDEHIGDKTSIKTSDFYSASLPI
ncbi:hypothetical protein PG990_001120 [Apiospora arundinis]